MAKPALLLRYSVPLASLALLCASQPAFAQSKPAETDTKTESEEAVFIPVEYRPPPYQVSVGVRLAGKAKVKFSGLGAIPSSTYPGATAEANDSTKTYGRTYDDGTIYPDYTYSLNTDGTTYTRITPEDGKTNYWSFTSANQVVDLPSGQKALALHTYSVDSTGATEEASRNASMAWDIEISRELGANRRMSWGLLLGASISDITVKSDATVKGRLRTLTDYYSLQGVALTTNAGTGAIVPPSYTGSTEYYPYTYKLADDGVTLARDANGSYIPVYQYDPVTGEKIKAWPVVPRISTDPITGTRTDVAETVPSLDVIGHWEVRGAYMTARFGPYFTFQLARRLALRASAGITFTVIGASLRINERVYVPAKDAYMELNNQDYNIDPRVSGILGYFASCELDAFLTDRTGVFFGASHEGFQRDLSLQYASYQQRADVELSSGTVLRTGVTTRF